MPDDLPVVVLTTHSPNEYVIGQLLKPHRLEDVYETHGQDRVVLKYMVLARIVADPENTGNLQMHISPLLVSLEQMVDLRSFLSSAYLREDLKKHYDAWLLNYKRHSEVFKNEEEDGD